MQARDQNGEWCKGWPSNTNTTIRPLRITRTYLVQMSKIDIIIESEATMYALYQLTLSVPMTPFGVIR